MATPATPPPSCSSSSSTSSSRQQQQHHSAVVCKPRPLMLKDYLREDQNSDSFGRRFTTPPTSRWGAPTSSANTVRYLLTLELNNSTTTTNSDNRRSIGGKAHNAVGCSGGGGGGNNNNNNPLARLSAMINALKMLPFSNSSSSSSGSRGASLTSGSSSRKQQGGVVGLPRSLSKRLRRSFWKKCGDRGHSRMTGPCSELASRRVLVRDIVRRASLDDDRMGWVQKAKAAAAAASAGGTTTTIASTTTSAFTAPLPRPSSPPLKAKLHHSVPTTTTSTAGSSPGRPSCSTSIGASSWSELDSDSSSRSGSESVGSSSSPVPEFADPVAKPAAPSTLLSAEMKRSVFDDRRHDVENKGFPGSTDRRTCAGGGGGREVLEVPTLPTPAPTATGHRYSPEVQGTDGNRDSGMSFTCVQYEEKDQLSPVAVVDFPSSSSSDDDDGSASQSDGTQSTVGADEEDAEEAAAAAGAFHERLANIERVRHRLMWKIQQFETLVDLVDPADLTDAETAESVVDGDANGDDYVYDDGVEEEENEEEEAGTTIWTEGRVDAQARELLERLKASAAAGNGRWGVMWDQEALLMDLFIQGLWEHEERASASSNCTTATTVASRCIGDDDDGGRRRVEDDLLNAAREWLQATPMRRRRGVANVEVGTKAELIKELDRNGPWGRRCFDVEEADVVAGIADGFLDAVLAEMLFDMLMMTTTTTLVW